MVTHEGWLSAIGASVLQRNFDRDCYGQAERRLAEVLAENPDALPLGPIPRTGRADNRLIDYGYRDYAEMFNARQQLHLALLGAAIQKVRGRVRDGLAVAFSDHLTTNNMLCAYAGGWRRLARALRDPCLPSHRQACGDQPLASEQWSRDVSELCSCRVASIAGIEGPSGAESHGDSSSTSRIHMLVPRTSSAVMPAE